jgi:quercetin dioxygenase-like cupin family protein
MTHTILKPSFTRNDARGSFVEILNGGHWESLVMGSMNSGAIMGDHYHRETLIFFYLTRGAVTIRTIDVETQERDSFALAAGEGVILRTGESHAIHFDQPSDYLLMKSLRYDPANPDTYPYVVG